MSSINFRLRLFLLLGAGFASLARASDNDSELRAEVQAMRQAYESRIANLEEKMKDMATNGIQQQKSAEHRIDQALAQKGTATAAVSYEIPAGVNAVKSSTQMTLGGYTEFTYTNRTTRTPEFNQLKTVGEISAKLNYRMRLYIEVEEEQGAVIAGPERTQGEFEFEQAYLDFTIDKTLNFRAGTTLVPMGHYNLYHEGPINNLTDRPLVDRRIIPTTWYEEGIGFYGTPIDNNLLGVTYEAYMYNPAASAGVDPVSGFRDIHNEGKSPTSAQKAGAARLQFEPARSLSKIADTFEVGISGYASGFAGFKGTNPDGDAVDFHSGRLYMTAVDVTWEKKNLGFRGEAAYAHTGAGENSAGRQQSAWAITPKDITNSGPVS